MMFKPLSRRRFVGISAAAAGLALLSDAALAELQPGEVVTWQGRALGAEAQLLIHHHDRQAAQRIVAAVASEIERLEQMFSLYRSGSLLSILNRDGALAAPPIEMVELLDRCRDIWALSGGLFDPTVQPLWMLYALHYSAPGASADGPSRAAIDEALGKAGFNRIVFDQNRVAYGAPGMALTFNGVAQGYITDKVVDLLRSAGIANTLADIGEIRAMGERSDGTAWRVGIAGDVDVHELRDMAIATSSPDGFRFGGPGSPAHLLNPRTGLSAPLYASVSVTAPDAATADALSTACSFMTPAEIARICARRPGVKVRVRTHDGKHTNIS